MAINLRQMCNERDQLAPGHRLCPGCAEPVVVRQILHAIEDPVVVANATGCLEVSTSIFPYTSWRVPWIHSAFENASTTAAGAESMYRSLVRQGKMADNGTKFLAFGGDGATYDIGFQFLSGVWERGHKVLYVCLNNEAYMNTGIQRSSATPLGAWTTTSPVGRVRPGKRENRKNMTAIAVAHEIPYVAQASPHLWRDLMNKVQRALAADGPSFINVLAPCPRGWRSEPGESISISKLAADTCVWPLYEVIDGVWKLNYKPRNKRPVTDWMKSQGRFSHLLKPENEELVTQIQERVDKEWEALVTKCEAN
ncbi:MAG: pyruvate ferredoxin oxidoreductase [Chloroflexi bacterium]|nr:pyruvate ferredoxin oxidoreductase [Chloroflexota bacterium]